MTDKASLPLLSFLYTSQTEELSRSRGLELVVCDVGRFVVYEIGLWIGGLEFGGEEGELSDMGLRLLGSGWVAWVLGLCGE